MYQNITGINMAKPRLKRELYLLTSNSSKNFKEIEWTLFYRMKNNFSVELLILKTIKNMVDSDESSMTRESASFCHS